VTYQTNACAKDLHGGCHGYSPVHDAHRPTGEGLDTSAPRRCECDCHGEAGVDLRCYLLTEVVETMQVLTSQAEVVLGYTEMFDHEFGYGDSSDERLMWLRACLGTARHELAAAIRALHATKDEDGRS
jgi:hypothetical protein